MAGEGQSDVRKDGGKRRGWRARKEDEAGSVKVSFEVTIEGGRLTLSRAWWMTCN